MKYPVSLLLPAVLCTAVLLAPGCGNDTKDKPDFDRKTLLQHYADSLIRPACSDLADRVNLLKTSWTAFLSNPDSAGLATLQSRWFSAYTSWQHANAFNFGPAGESGTRKGLVEEIGTFPAIANKI